MFRFVLQRTPTNENNGGTEWQGIRVNSIRLSRFTVFNRRVNWIKAMARFVYVLLAYTRTVSLRAKKIPASFHKRGLVPLRVFFFFQNFRRAATFFLYRSLP